MMCHTMTVTDYCVRAVTNRCILMSELSDNVMAELKANATARDIAVAKLYTDMVLICAKQQRIIDTFLQIESRGIHNE